MGFLIEKSHEYQLLSNSNSLVLFSSAGDNPFEHMKQEYLDFIKIKDRSEGFKAAYHNFMHQNNMSKNYYF